VTFSGADRSRSACSAWCFSPHPHAALGPAWAAVLVVILAVLAALTLLPACCLSIRGDAASMPCRCACRV